MPIARFRIACTGPDRVVIVRDGKTVVDVSPELALDLARAMTAKARQAQALRPKVMDGQADDMALLLRRGIRLGLSDDPRVKREALQRAQHDPVLRRAIPSSEGIGEALTPAGVGGIAPRSVVGAPALVDLSKPKEA